MEQRSDAGNVMRLLEQHSTSLSSSEVKLASHLANHPEEWAFEPANVLAKVLSVHRSTIVRFAQRLGFMGFPDLQRSIRSEYLAELSDERETLRVVAETASSADGSTLRGIFARESQNLVRTYDRLDEELVERVAELLATAHRVVVLGRRFSFPIAQHLSLALRTMRDDVQLAPEPGGSILDTVFDLGPEDFGVVISMKRNSPEVRSALSFMADAGVPNTLLSDAGPLPNVPSQTMVIRAHTGGTSILDSYTALTSVSHALLSLASKHLPNAEARLHDLEDAWKYLVRLQVGS